MTVVVMDVRRTSEGVLHMTEFFVLGPLECRSANRPVNIAGTLQRALLATLLAAEGTPVSADSLVAELWGDSPPPHWENALQAHISRLRRRIDTVAGGGRSARLVVEHSGYCLRTDDDTVDAKVFMRKFDYARLLGTTDPRAAAEALREALSLWRGRAFGLVTQGSLCRTVAQRYETARLVALETLFDLELRSGRHTDIIPMLSELVEAPTLNERFCEQLMIALYRSGQQALALSSYSRMRERLDAELGVEPTITLRNLLNAILNHDPALRLGADHAVLRA
ncbi:BTAD domain-containing putative transcriptional regulator [Spirillospora sp. NPDC047279]|uniref:AfsR/SARP family transcriptional regulator n=1 Tax=Spirillospora sp. NPDC047279 TaxID=3155478 RepID=UPI0033E94114